MVEPSEVNRVLNRVLARRRIALAGFRKGRVPAPVALSRRRQLCEDALCHMVRQQCGELLPRLREAVVPAEFKPGGLRPEGSFSVEVHWLEMPQPPQPWKGMGVAAGVEAYAAPAMPATNGLSCQELMPEAVRNLPQMQHFRLGGAEPTARGRTTSPGAPQAGRVSLPQLPQFPGQAGAMATGRKPQAPTADVELPRTPEPVAAPAGGAR